MPSFVEVAVIVPQAQGVFDYHLPPELEGRLQGGSLVLVPFGRQTVHGVVLRSIEQPQVAETRPVLDLVDPAAVLTPAQISLAHRLAEQTLAPLAACIALMLPPGLGGAADTLYSLRPVPDETVESALAGGVTSKKLYKLLMDRGPLRGAQIDRALPRADWRKAARGLARRGLLETSTVLPAPQVRPKTARTVQLAGSPAAAEAALPDLGRANTAALTRRQAMLRFLLQEGGPVDVAWVYAHSGGNLQDLCALAERGLVTLGESEVWRDPLGGADFLPDRPPLLTSDQQALWQDIHGKLEAAWGGETVQPVLLHGVTGSGKTEIYLHAVDAAIAAGRQAIILAPEIALTPQTVRRFASRFPGLTGLVHSRLSMGERYDTWRRARSGALALVVGPRSALFTPFPRLGLIVVDECHDDSYYQGDVLPYYHAAAAAIEYARLAGAGCILGSATPDIATTYQASQGKIHYLHLPNRILAHRQALRAQLDQVHINSSQYRTLEGDAETIDLPVVNLVDMRQELQAGNRSIFSRSLQGALGQVLRQKQQAILFLNRRGTATYVFCRQCGHTLKCPRCAVPLTYHLEDGQGDLRCHYCGYRRKLPQTCPECGGRQIRHYGSGTERVEAELVKLFPQARPLRWDYETTRRKGAHEAILGHFIARRADVLIGTQMIAKGLDLPLVTLVGAVLADVGLNLPDYRAAERTFQVLTQVAGRAGRSPLGGQVILQTFMPEHYVIQAAARHSYRDFYQKELAYRKQLGYPPFAQLIRLEYRHSDAQKTERAAFKLGEEIRNWMAQAEDRATEIVGPAPCFFERISGEYRWQIVLRGPEPLALLRDHPLADWKIEVNPPNLL